MKPARVLTQVTAGVLVLVLLSCGCTQEQKPVTMVTPTPVPSSTLTMVPTPTTNPYPDAKPLNTPVAFGSGDMTGTATVTKYYIKPNYTWTSPAWRSAHAQAVYAPALETQTGYNTETPAAGNTFLILYFRIENTGTKAIVAPSPRQIVVSVDGNIYGYLPVSDSGVIIDGISGTQYDYLLGTGGTGGYVQPGPSNAAEGYLIYEIPESATPDKIFILANADYQTQAVWVPG